MKQQHSEKFNENNAAALGPLLDCLIAGSSLVDTRANSHCIIQVLFTASLVPRQLISG